MRTIKTYSKRAPFYNAFTRTPAITSGLPTIHQVAGLRIVSAIEIFHETLF